MKNERMDALIETAQKAFIAEIGIKIKEMDSLLTSYEDCCTANDAERILRFFHSIHGTAATLELVHLASIGKEWEFKVRNLIEHRNGLDQAALKDIHEEILKISQIISYIGGIQTRSMQDASQEDYVNMQDRGKVLLVDDDVTILKLLENALTMDGYTVYICDEPEAAMDLIAATRPDVVMLDIMMPDMNGYELLEKIKSKPEFCDMHVIFLSAVNSVEDRIKGMKAGADDYITKPFIIDEVVARVETAMRRSSKYREKLLMDDLTDAYSRCYFHQRIIEEIEKYRRYGTLFSIALLDMDHYKGINDKYGHQTGDYVLKAFVSFLVKSIRKCDSLYRFGGEEFVLLLPDTPESKAYYAVDRVRNEFAQNPISVGGSKVSATFSAGIIQIDDKDITCEQLIGYADKAMYHAKKLGRNRTVVYNKHMNTRDFKKTLLLVDDENTILKLLRDKLSNIGYNIITAKDGQSAIRLTGEVKPDAVILDLILPDIDGFEVCRQIKGNAATRATKVIMLSKKKEKKNIVKGLYAGADDYLTKPFSMLELEARIMSALNS